MKKKHFPHFIIMLILPFLLIACSNGTKDQDVDSDSDTPETITLQLAENESEDFPTTLGDKEFAKLVEEKTEGRYKIEVFSGGQLGDEKSVIEQIQLGSIDLARVNGTPLTQFNDNIGVFSLPFLFESAEEKWEVWNGKVGEEILESFLEDNMVGLAYYDNGERFFYNSQRPVEYVEDMEGLKIRVQESDLAIDIVEATGASATPMAYEEVYSSLQTGVIDGAENNFPSFYDVSHHEVTQYITLPGYQAVPEVLIGSKKLWDSLNDEDQLLFKEAAIESVDTQRNAWDELVIESREKVEENGNEINEIKDFSQWEEKFQDVYDEHGEKYKEWLDKIENN